MTPTQAASLLRQAGLRLPPDAIAIEPRDGRWLDRLPDDRIAWFPATPAGARRLAAEAQILSLLAARCTFAVPTILYQDETGWQLRTIVPGLSEPWRLYSDIRSDPAKACKIGHALGAILAQQHVAIRPEDVATLLPHRPDWPQPSATLWQTLPLVVEDHALLARIRTILARYEAPTPNDPVLLHTDLGLHNIAIDPVSFAVRGIFDYDSAAWADRHHDFRYLVFPDGKPHQPLLDAALETYETTLNLRLDLARIRLNNVACAIGFLAHRHGTRPDALSCGRTLAQDLDWLHHAIQDLKLR